MGFSDWPEVASPPANAGDVGSISGSGRCPGEGNILATHSSILGWKIPWMEEPCRLQRVRHELAFTCKHIHIYIHSFIHTYIHAFKAAILLLKLFISYIFCI